MIAECPHCHTVFNLEEDQLNQADGQVRCGHCLAIFSVENPYQNTTTDSFDEFTEQQVEPSADEEFESGHTILADVIPPELREQTRNPKRNYGALATIFWSLAILAMLIIGVLQYAHYDRFRLVQYNELRPWLNLMCTYLECDLPEPRDTARIELSNKNIFSHPNSGDALMVSASIVNQSTFEQAFPLLELKFENVRGETIAGRRFTAEEYLGIPADQIPKMIPGESTSISVEIIDPGKDMVSYTFEFL